MVLFRILQKHFWFYNLTGGGGSDRWSRIADSYLVSSYSTRRRKPEKNLLFNNNVKILSPEDAERKQCTGLEDAVATLLVFHLQSHCSSLDFTFQAICCHSFRQFLLHEMSRQVGTVHKNFVWCLLCWSLLHLKGQERVNLKVAFWGRPLGYFCWFWFMINTEGEHHEQSMCVGCSQKANIFLG